MAEHSGRFVLRIPPELHARLAHLARETGRSLNEYCRKAIEHYTDSGARGATHSGSGGRWVDVARALVGDHLESVLLFGSQARGEATSSSDTDLLIVISQDVVLSRELYHRWDDLALDPPVNPHFVHLPDGVLEAGSIWYEVALDGIMLYERDRRTSAFLQSVRQAIADGRLRRLYAHGHPYWVKRTEASNA